MRIDYSEPKQSYVASHGKGKVQPQARKQPAGLITTLVIIAVIIGFVSGFGTGWFFSQRSAKKSFQAAAEQNSLENATKQPEIPIAPPKIQPQPASTDSDPQKPQPEPGAVQAVPAVATPQEPPLSFYKTLPSGQKNNVLGSGINTSNTRDDKSKQPLQAAMPSNVIKQQQPAVNKAKPVANKSKSAEENDPAADKPVADKPSPKSSSKAADRGFVVQVASFSLKSEAETLKKTLANKGYNVTVSESNLGDKGLWYRVRVGKRLEQDAAKVLSGKLGRGAIVIPDHD